VQTATIQDEDILQSLYTTILAVVLCNSCGHQKSSSTDSHIDNVLMT